MPNPIGNVLRVSCGYVQLYADGPSIHPERLTAVISKSDASILTTIIETSVSPRCRSDHAQANDTSTDMRDLQIKTLHPIHIEAIEPANLEDSQTQLPPTFEAFQYPFNQQQRQFVHDRARHLRGDWELSMDSLDTFVHHTRLSRLFLAVIAMDQYAETVLSGETPDETQPSAQTAVIEDINARTSDSPSMASPSITSTRWQPIAERMIEVADELLSINLFDESMQPMLAFIPDFERSAPSAE